TISLGDVGSAHRRRLIAPGFDALQEVPKVCLEVRLIVLGRDAIDARRSILAGPYVGFSHPFEVEDMIQREQHRSRLLPCQFDPTAGDASWPASPSAHATLASRPPARPYLGRTCTDRSRQLCLAPSSTRATGSGLLRPAERHQLPSRKIVDPARFGK